MKKKKIVIALGHDALGTTLPEQHEATKHTAKAVADFIRDDYEVVITHIRKTARCFYKTTHTSALQNAYRRVGYM